MTHKTVTILRDPSGRFEKDAKFDMLNLAGSVWFGSWPPGIVFDVNGRRAKMVGKILVREDGKRLRVWGGCMYEWVD